MPPPRRSFWALAAVLVLGCVTFLTGIDWGLPTRATDAYLFGDPADAWPGQRITAAGGAWAPDAGRAADADASPVDRGDRPVPLNDTDGRRAQVIRRYRLFSAQPDEMVTFMSLAGMRGGNFDPRMYQYGGVWIYPVGGLLKLASAIGAVTVRSDLNYYLDRPEDFARFYVVARFYSAACGLVGIWAVFRLMTRFAAGTLWPATAAACFALMPVVINAAHEAKPHLAGAVLTLLAVLAGTRYVETGRRRWWAACGALCGLAVGMVLSAAVAFVVIPLTALLRREPAPSDSPGSAPRARTRIVRRLNVILAAGAIAVLAYCVTNPYVPINLLRNPAVVRENLGALGRAKALTGSANDLGAVANARRLIADGASIVGGVFGVTAALVALFNVPWWRRNPRGRAVAVLLGVPAAIVLAQFTALAAGKTGEFGRFAILPDVALVLAAVVLAANLGPADPLGGDERGQPVGGGQSFRGRLGPALLAIALIGTVSLQGVCYLRGFVADARGGTRAEVSRRLAELWRQGARTLGVPSEPAPYCLPPADVTRWRIVLLPDGATQPPPDVDVIVAPVDERRPTSASGAYATTFVAPDTFFKTRISWADKPFELRVRREFARP